MGRPKGSTNKRSGAGPFFRDFYMKNRKLLGVRSNKLAYAAWLEAHPGARSVPENIKNGLANVKSGMRSKKRKYQKADSTNGVPEATARPKQITDAALEKLEISIDDCITMAHNMGREFLEDVLKALRIARRRVVLIGGE